jgi:hypothetical protein
MELRRILVISDTAYPAGSEKVRRVAACAVVRRSADLRGGLEEMMELGEELGRTLSAEALSALGGPVLSYGKAAIIGLEGEAEHAAAILHPRMGRPMRDAIGGGQALIPSTAKVAAAGAHIDVPLGHKDDAWAFEAIDTITVMVPEAPRPDEMVVIVAFADGPRPNARITKSGVTPSIPTERSP